MSNSKKTNSRRPSSQFMKLEQRLMFDGAVVDTTLETFIPDGADAVDTSQDVSGQELFATAVAYGESDKAAEDAQAQVKAFLQDATAEDLFALFNGTQEQPTQEWLDAANALRDMILNDEFSLQVEWVGSDVLGLAKGAFAQAGLSGEPAIYLNADMAQSWLEAPELASVLVEELGHAIDFYLNGANDTEGDEGHVFAANVLGEEYGAPSADDHGTIEIDGQSIEVEFASFNFVSAYKMVTDTDGDGVVENTESWAEKEQERHFLIPVDLGTAEINDDTNSGLFSGNDVAAIGINIAGEEYYGWISRPVKIQGQVVAFYFWTDADFTSLALAQTDGNQDGDSDVRDNSGFILVVDQAKFLANVDTISISYTADNPLTSANDPTAYTSYYKIGSSSDRVDNALNALLPTNTNPVANPDTDTSAVELGYNNNTSSIITATVNATGNVITNDTDANTSDNLSVIEASSKSTGGNTAVTTSGVTIAGQYGSVTIKSDGSYTYVINNNHATVDALLTGDLDDVFNYTLSDGNGGTASTTLTITIQGSNDAPVAVDDYNFAKESLTDDGVYTNDGGFIASGNVLPNDTDVDNGDTKSISGLSQSGEITSSTVNVNTGGFSLTFDSVNGASVKTVKVGSEVYVDMTPNESNSDFSGIFIKDPNDATKYVHVTVVSAATLQSDGTYDMGLSSDPKYYWDISTSTFVAIADFAQFIKTYSNFRFQDTTTAANPTIGGGSDTTVISKNTGKPGTSALGETVGYTTLSGFTNETGTITEGMTVTGTGVPSGTIVQTVNRDTAGSITSIIVNSGALTSSSGTTFTFTSSGSAGTSYDGAFGTLTLNSDGSYVYKPFEANTELSEGDSVVESFDYTMQDTAGVTSEATLYITVYGSGTNDPVAFADTDTADEKGTHTDKGTVLDAGSTATGSVLSNDITPAGTNVVTTAGLLGTSNSSVTAGTTSANGRSITGQYGTLVIGANGTYEYTVDDTDATVNALAEGETLSETFVYTIENGQTGTNGNNLISASTLTITINGANDAPVAVNDALSVYEDGVTGSGQVLFNDTDVDNGDTKTVIEATAGSHDDVTAANLPSYQSVTVTGVPVTGSYGTLTIKADGSYTYAVDNSNPTVQALNAGSTAIVDTFTYRMKDAAGEYSDATITVSVNGAIDPPINTFGGNETFGGVTTAINTQYAFTGSSQLQVTDLDTDVDTVILHVDNGTLDLTGSGSAVLTGSGSADVKITGTQAEINAVLASLKYTPTTGFTGNDYLTIFSQDTQNAFDSDSVVISIPTVFNALTVKESDLASGTNPSGTDETVTSTLTLPLGQAGFVAETSGSGTYGSWTIDASGAFSYTLTTQANHGPISETLTIQTYDAFGNIINNTITVNIVDDAPIANDDTGSVTEGATLTVNAANGVLQDNDVSGADGWGSPAIVGVVTGSDDTVDTTDGSNVGSELIGTYGKLTLNADGSYTYVTTADSITADATDTFVYTVVDGDGSYDSAILTITVSNVTGVAASTTATVTEAGLTNGTNAGTGHTLTSQALSLQTGWTVQSAQSGTASFGTWSVATDGTFSYTLTSTTTDLAGAETDTFSYTVKDANGNSVTNTVTITITDDAPLATNDSASVIEGNTVTVNVANGVLSNDESGADGWHGTTIVGVKVGNDTSSPASGSVGSEITGSYGKLTLNADGSYTYVSTANAITTNVVEKFVYSVKDADGDITSAVIEISIVDLSGANLALTKTVSDATPDLDDNVTFTLTVTNNGPANATGVAVADLLPTGFEYVSDNGSGAYNSTTGVWTLGSLANAATSSLQITVKAVSETSVTNTATVTADQNDPDTSDNTDTASVDAVAADLSVIKSVDDQTPDLNGNVVYTIVVTNDGSDAATNVVMTDALPAGLEFVSADSFNYNATTGVWSVGNMAANTSQTLKITAKVVAVTAINNVAEVSSDTYDPDTTNNRDDGSSDPNGNNQRVDVPEADLSVTKSVDDQTPDLNGNVVYTIVVTNGGVDTAENVVMTDALPAGLEFVSADSTNYNATTGVWSVGNMAANTSQTLKITAKVVAVTAINNVAEVSSDTYDPDTTNNRDDGSSDPNGNNQRVDVPEADLSVTKSVDDQTPDLNGNVVYTIVVTNGGVDTAENVVMTDALPAGLEFVSADSTNYNATTGVWSVGNMAANTSQTLKITAKVVAVTAINNVAEVTSDTYDPDTTNNRDDGSSDPNGNNQKIDVPEADLSVSKMVDNQSPLVGDNVTYTIVVKNAGVDTAENVVMTDELPDGLVFVSADSSDYDATTGIWTLGDLASGASATLKIVVQVTGTGELNNIATVTSDTFDPDETDNLDDGSTDTDENGNPIPNNQRVTPLNVELLVTGPEAPVSEGSDVIFDVELSNPMPTDQVIEFSTSPITTSEGELGTITPYYIVDGEIIFLEPASNGGFIVPAGVTDLKVAVQSIQDGDLEGLESFSLNASLRDIPGATDSDDGAVIDDGSGVVLLANGSLDPNGVPDDDTPPPPVPAPQSAPAPFVAPAAGPAAPVEPVVIEVEPVEPPPPPQGELVVQRDIPIQEAKYTEDGLALIDFTIPADTFDHTGDLDYTLSAVMDDGSELPAWLIFNAEKGEFSGTAPEGFEGVLVIRVIARDDSGAQVETSVRIEVKKGGASNDVVGKLHIIDQMQQDDHFAWKQARDKWVAMAKQLADKDRLAG